MLTSFPKEKIKILLLEGIHPSAVDLFQKAGYTQIESLKQALSEAQLIERLQDGVHLLGIRSKTQVSAQALNHAPRLLSLGCFCIGTNQVDLDHAKEKGVAVFNSPYSNTRSVAELVIAEMIMLMRRIPEKDRAAHDGLWFKAAKGCYEVRGKTLGIVGYGHIGSQVSVLAESLGLKVIYYDIIPKLPLGNATPVDSLELLLAMSDVVSLHVPADESTYHLLNAATMAQMKKGAILLNLSRGSVVNIDDLYQALKSKHIAGAGIDVFPREPKANNELFSTPLQRLPNVILTPHIGGSTMEAQESIGRDVALKLINFIDKGITVGSHSVPEISLPAKQGTHRLLHIHRNVPGVLSAINRVISDMNINIEGQYLSTNDKIGYVVLDITQSVAAEALDKLREVEHTIRARILY
jgi:D-3-phosphoglycerate dehydrogenase